jgi:hypothetical protein
LVVLIFAVTEFTRGAWVVVVAMPILIYGLVKTNAQYRAEDAVLDEGVALAACEAPVLRRHTAIVLVDRIDLATARAIQYARSLNPDELYAVHFNVDNTRAEAVMRRWRDLGLSKLPLEVIEVSDRRLGRAALEMVTRAARDGQTEVSVLIPTRSYRRSWALLLHGKNADRLVRVLGHVPHVNATLVPFNVADLAESQRALASPELMFQATNGRASARKSKQQRFTAVPGTIPIATLRFRQRAKVAGRLHSVRIQPLEDVPTLEGALTDASGGELRIVFLGRRQVPGIRTGTQLVAEGMVGDWRGQLAMLNPDYELLSVPEAESDAGA